MRSYDASRDCADGKCIISRLVDFTAVLANSSSALNDRLEALKWVVHFVGDIHQPLHAADNNDQGGNTVRLTYFGKQTTLHTIWVQRDYRERDGPEGRPELQHRLPPLLRP